LGSRKTKVKTDEGEKNAFVSLVPMKGGKKRKPDGGGEEYSCWEGQKKEEEESEIVSESSTSSEVTNSGGGKEKNNWAMRPTNRLQGGGDPKTRAMKEELENSNTYKRQTLEVYRQIVGPAGRV